MIGDLVTRFRQSFQMPKFVFLKLRNPTEAPTEMASQSPKCFVARRPRDFSLNLGVSPLEPPAISLSSYKLLTHPNQT